MGEDSEEEWARSVARLFRGLYEDGVIADAEAALSHADAAGLPMPETAHPAYTSNASAVRALMAADRPYIAVPRTYRAAYVMAEEVGPPTEPIRAVVLTVRKAAGPAPFVGDPRVTRAMYVWRVAVDDAGRHVAGPATLQWAQVR